MSRTRRRLRPRMRLGTLSDHQYSDGRVRDGTPQHYTASCEHHGECAWCRGNRLHGSCVRRQAMDGQEDELYEEWSAASRQQERTAS